jgi:hypothetical protein
MSHFLGLASPESMVNEVGQPAQGPSLPAVEHHVGEESRHDRVGERRRRVACRQVADGRWRVQCGGARGGATAGISIGPQSLGQGREEEATANWQEKGGCHLSSTQARSEEERAAVGWSRCAGGEPERSIGRGREADDQGGGEKDTSADLELEVAARVELRFAVGSVEPVNLYKFSGNYCFALFSKGKDPSVYYT